MPGFFASSYQRRWWSILLRGIIAVAFGILAIGWPDRVLAMLVTLIGILILVIGLVATIGAILHRGESKKWLLALVPGVVGIIIGIVAMASPAVTVIVLVYLIAIWALVHGISEIYNALKLRKDMAGEWMPILIGIVSTIFGVVLLARPRPAAAAVTWLVGLFALIMGVLWLILAFRARNWPQA